MLNPEMSVPDYGADPATLQLYGWKGGANNSRNALVGPNNVGNALLPANPAN